MAERRAEDMNVIMVMVMSVDGKITRWDDPDVYIWTSKEDQKHFFSLLEKSELVVMGSKTFEVARKKINLERKTFRTVLTRNPAKYKIYRVPGKLEFTSEKPKQLVKRLEKEGYKTMFLVGGPILNGSFLKENLVDELYLTVEPNLFGSGKSLIEGVKIETDLKLVSIKKLNKRGTLLLRYSIYLGA